MTYLTAPRGAYVFCCQCGLPYAIEPDQCDNCGCRGFQHKPPPRKSSDGEQR